MPPPSKRSCGRSTAARIGIGGAAAKHASGGNESDYGSHSADNSQRCFAVREHAPVGIVDVLFADGHALPGPVTRLSVEKRDRLHSEHVSRVTGGFDRAFELIDRRPQGPPKSHSPAVIELQRKNASRRRSR